MKVIETYKGVKIFKSEKTGFYKCAIMGGDVSSLAFLKKLIDLKK
jgi:hypothetical protein